MMDRLLRACWREAVDRTPVWFMRQAGRSSPSYRAIRETRGVLEIAKTPKLAAEVTIEPVRELGVDAAILFADLLLPLEAMGMSVRMSPGEGPVVESPIRTPEDVDRLKPLDPERDLPFVLETIRRARTKLEVPLIGFAGAPFTVASYLIEGGPSRDLLATKRFMNEHAHGWRRLLDLLAEGAAAYIRAQAEAGIQAVQLFDSWAGVLSPLDYEGKVGPYTRRVFDGIKESGIPSIHFGTGTAGLLESFTRAGGDVIGIDWRVRIDDAWERIGPDHGIQGNLDPSALLGPPDGWRAPASEILDRVEGRAGHIFNLGHGVLPETPRDRLKALVEFVHGRARDGRVGGSP
ncbi:MAG TPA: uroporphyrinogen decarboxylase [Thermoplasmata archaeon]|nr:uroporphyrinogen decarboxylase [Thermoplasmata archaeon]